MGPRTPLALAMIAPLLSAASVCGQDCPPSWSTDFGLAGLSAPPADLAFFDEDSAGPLPATYYAATPTGVIRWDGPDWSPLGVGLTSVSRLAVLDPDGAGPAPARLYAGGLFTSETGGPSDYVAVWNGSAWAPVGAGPVFTASACGNALGILKVLGPSSARRLYAGIVTTGSACAFSADSTQFSVWDGAAWAPVAAGTPFFAAAADVELIEAGAGPGVSPGLYVVGRSAQTLLPSQPPIVGTRLAFWNGAFWEPLSGSAFSQFLTLAAFDEDGPGPAGASLFLGGQLLEGANLPAGGIARWNGLTWSGVGAGVLDGAVMNLRVFSGSTPGATPMLYAAGAFSTSGTLSIPRVARWNGQVWQGLTGGTQGPFVSRLIPAESPGLPTFLALIGDISAGGLQPAQGIARWTGGDWAAPGDCLNNEVHALASYGGSLYAGGTFTWAGNVRAVGLARWNGSAWSIAGASANHHVDALAVYNGRLVAAGKFSVIGGIAASRVAQWDGSAWSRLGTGMNGPVLALAVSGSALYAGGLFTTADGAPASNIARWTGTAWQPLGSGTDGQVDTLAVHDDGGGPALFAGGRFLSAGGISAPRIARWRGSAWSAAGAFDNEVLALAVHQTASGPALFAGGLFTSPPYIARYSPSGWQPIGPPTGAAVRALASIDPDGAGPDAPVLVAGGNFHEIAGAAAEGVAVWDGLSWHALGAGVDGPVLAVAPFDPDGAGPSRARAMVGGSFSRAAGIPSPRLAAWPLCPIPCYANCDGSTAPPILNVNDFVCFQARFAQGDPAANCDSSTAPPTLNVADFVCFLNEYAAGCP